MGVANITQYTKVIETAQKGEDVRDSIISALRAINDGATVPSIDTSLSGTSTNPVQNKVITSALNAKMTKIEVDDTPIDGSNHLVRSGGIRPFVEGIVKGKQPTLAWDSAPTEGSKNAITSGALYDALEKKQNVLAFDSHSTRNSNNLLTSGQIYDELNDKQNIADIKITYDITPDSDAFTYSKCVYDYYQKNLAKAVVSSGSGSENQVLVSTGAGQTKWVDSVPLSDVTSKTAGSLTIVDKDGITILDRWDGSTDQTLNLPDGTGITIDDKLDENSSNPIQNGAITKVIRKVDDKFGGLKLWKGSQDEYNSLQPSDDTLYIIV